jgi:hypothetical protein
MGRCGSTPAACANAPKKPRAQATNRVLAILVIPFKSFNCARRLSSSCSSQQPAALHAWAASHWGLAALLAPARCQRV